MQRSKKEKSGCLWIFIFGLLSLFGYILADAILGASTLVSLMIAIGIAGYLTSRWLGLPSVKGLIINSAVIIGIIVVIRVVGSLFLEILENSTPATFKKEEGISKTMLIENNDTIDVYSSHRIWKDNFGNDYEGQLTIRDRDFQRLYNHISTFKYSNTKKNFWGSLYAYIDKKDGPSLDLVMKTFEKINKERKLNQMEFAEMVVSCIQDIPYSFVFQEECMDPDAYEPNIRYILEDCPDCCIGNVWYGIQNPVSFLQNLKGDCDTRTVLIYSILKHFNYDVAILNSDFYRHSIIGVNIPSAGLHKMYRGKKYVVWETTAKYYEVGKLPSNFNDITHWNVILTSK